MPKLHCLRKWHLSTKACICKKSYCNVSTEKFRLEDSAYNVYMSLVFQGKHLLLDCNEKLISLELFPKCLLQSDHTSTFKFRDI